MTDGDGVRSCMHGDVDGPTDFGARNAVVPFYGVPTSYVVRVISRWRIFRHLQNCAARTSRFASLHAGEVGVAAREAWPFRGAAEPIDEITGWLRRVAGARTRVLTGLTLAPLALLAAIAYHYSI